MLLWKSRDDDDEMKWEVLRKKITKRSGKSCGIYTYHQVKMACITANLLLLQKMNSVAHSCRLHGLPNILQFAPGWSDVVCLLTGINDGERPPESHVCEIITVNSSTQRMSADVCLK